MWVKQNYWVQRGLDYAHTPPYCDTDLTFTRSVNGVAGRKAAFDIRWQDARPMLLNDSGKSVWVQPIDHPSDPQTVSFQYELRPFAVK